MAQFKNKKRLLLTSSETTTTHNINSLEQVIEINLSNYIGATSSNAVELTLPELSQNLDIGYEWKLMILDNSNDTDGKTVQISASGSDTIDGSTTYVHAFTNANTDAFFIEYASNNLWTINKSAGIEGTQGPQGDVGQDGAQGPQGPQGELGPQGDTGQDGVQGPQGELGPQGDTGQDGVQGPQGELGPQGDTGQDGVQGPQGELGPQGDTGQDGAQGPQGITGPSGCIMEYSLGLYTQDGKMQFGGGAGPIFGLNYVADNDTIWKEWLSSFNAFDVKIKGIDSVAHSAFTVTNVIHSEVGATGGNLLGFINQSSFTIGGTFNADKYCVDITPSDASSDVTCYDSSDVIDFTTSATYSIILDSPIGLGLNTNSEVVVYDTNEPTNLIVIDVESYTEDLDTLSATISGVVITNAGSGTASNLCFIPQNVSSSAGFLYEKTLFVDPNGNDDLAANFLIGGNNTQPFKTIQAAMTYADTNYGNLNKVNIHVHAGVYIVSNDNPIEFFNGPIINLHLDNGVDIRDNGSLSTLGTTYDDRKYLIHMVGSSSISGEGELTLVGNNDIYLDAIFLDGVIDSSISFKRIKMNGSTIREGFALYFKPQSGKSTTVNFKGQIKINYESNGVLLTNSASTESDAYFIFSDDTIVSCSITPSLTLGNYLYRSYDSSEAVSNGSCSVILRGKTQLYSNQNSSSITLLYVDKNSASNQAIYFIFDGFEALIYTAEAGGGYHYLIGNNNISNVYFSTLNKATTNCYIDLSSSNYINDTMGFLALGVSSLKLPKLS